MANARFARTPAKVCLLLTLITISGLAQQSGTDLAELTLEQLGNMKVYTASKHLESGGEAPSSVTVITAEEIQKHGYRTLAHVLQTVRGFFVTYDRNYSSLGVRGFARPGDFNTRILLLVDGHRLNDNIYDEAMLGTEFPIDIDLIARIEIVRGPVSSLYGSNALFAVINIITRRGQDINGLELSGEAGSFNAYKGRMSYGRNLREVDFLVSGTFYGSRGHNTLFFPQLDTPEANYGIASHMDDDQMAGGLATISFREFTLQTAYGTRDKGIPTGPYGALFSVYGTRTTDAHGYIDLRYEHTFGGSWNVIARGYYDRYTYQGTYMYASPRDAAQVSTDLDYADGKWWGTEVELRKTILKRNRLTVGGEYRDNIRQNQSNFSLNPYELLLDDRRSSYVGAAYVQDELNITKSLTLNAGLRYDFYNRVQASLDPRAALIYRAWRDSAFKVIYGEAFRVPNVYELYYAAPALLLLPNPSLRPEKIRSTEVVWEQGISRSLWLSTSGFVNHMDGLITQVPTPTNELIFQNLQDVNASGVELELSAQLPTGLEGNVSYSFQQTKDVATSEFLSNSPRNLVKLELSQPLLHRKMFLSLDAQYRSRIQSLDSGSISPFMVVNAALLCRNLGNHLDLSAAVYNLFDRKYFDPPSSENLQLPIQQDGRGFRVKLTWHWGEP